MPVTSRTHPTHFIEINSTIKNSGTRTADSVEGKWKPIVTKVAQEDEANFDGVGLVRISAHEDIGSTHKLVFTKVPTGEELLSVSVGNSYWTSQDDDHSGMNPKLRFK